MCTRARRLPGRGNHRCPQTGAAKKAAPRPRQASRVPALRLCFVAALGHRLDLRRGVLEPNLQRGLDQGHLSDGAALRTWAALAEAVELEGTCSRRAGGGQQSGIENVVARNDDPVVDTRGAIGAGAAMNMDRRLAAQG